jgi:hypothetical protein
MVGAAFADARPLTRQPRDLCVDDSQETIGKLWKGYG